MSEYGIDVVIEWKAEWIDQPYVQSTVFRHLQERLSVKKVHVVGKPEAAPLGTTYASVQTSIIWHAHVDGALKREHAGALL